MTAPTYAKAGETPGYQFFRIFDRNTGAEVTEVVEVDAGAGWVRRYQTEDGCFLADEHGNLAVERIEGDFEIRDMRS